MAAADLGARVEDGAAAEGVVVDFLLHENLSQVRS